MSYASGVVQLPDNGISTPTQNTKLIAQWQGPERPCEIGLAVRGFLGYEGYPPPLVEGYTGKYFPGAPTQWEPWLAAGFRVTYGRAGLSRTVDLDLRTGRHYLGVCESVRIEAMRWRQTAWASVAGTVEVGADVGEASGGLYDEPTATILHTFPAAAAVSATALPPAQARFASPLVLPNATGVAVWGSANPDLQFRGGGMQAVTYRFSSYQIVPPFPRLQLAMGGESQLFAVSSGGVVLATDLVVGVRYFLGL
jgi:hypothetical protein